MSMADADLACRTLHLQGDSLESAVEQISARFGPFEAQATQPRRDFPWRADFAMSDAATVLTATCSGGWRLRPAGGVPSFLAVTRLRSGRMDMLMERGRIAGSPACLLLAESRETREIAMLGEVNVSDTLFLDGNALVRAIADMAERPVQGDMGFLPDLSLSQPSGATVAGLLDVIFDGMRPGGLLLQSPLALGRLIDSLTCILVRHVPHNHSQFLDEKPATVASRQVRQAIEFMHANIDRHITAERVAESVGVSSRSLQMAFRGFEKTTPAAYLRKIRLEAARRDLLDPACLLSIREICLKWGFFHIGRFSDTYRKAYGETPSETRRRVDCVP